MEFNWISTEKLTELLLPDLYQKKYISNVEKIKKSCLPLNRLASISTEIRRGKTPKHEEFQFEKSGLLLKTTNIRENEIDTRKLFYAKLDDIDKTYFLQEGDICITIMGATEDIIGRSWTYNSFVGKATFSDAIARIKGVKIDPYYLSTFLNSSYGKLEVRKWSGSSTRSYVTNTRLGNDTIPIPSPEIQKYIGDKVRKAEITREEAKECLKDASILFDSQITFPAKPTTKFDWISDFLVSDNISPKFYRQFDLIKENKKGFNYFDSFIKTIKCGDPIEKDVRYGTDFKYYGASGPIDTIGKYNFFGDYLIVSQDGSIGIANVAHEKFWANNHVWVIKLRKGDYEFFELYLNRYPYWNSLVTGSVVPKVTAENLRKVIILDVDESNQNQIGKLIRIAKQKENYSNTLICSAIKDVENLIEGNFRMEKEYLNLIN